MPSNLEIERKFVVDPTYPDWKKIQTETPGKRLIQSTIHEEKGYKLRIRMIEDITTGERSSYFCFKVNRSNKHDMSMREEYEWPVPSRNALYMMIGHGEISKIRREWHDASGQKWEIDEYEGANAGIITADVEVSDPKKPIAKPLWCGWDVKDDKRLSNTRLQKPEYAYSTWTESDKKWYLSMQSGDGISIWPKKGEKDTKKKDKSLWKRVKKAWHVLEGEEEEKYEPNFTL